MKHVKQHGVDGLSVATVDAELAARLQGLYEDAKSGLRRVIALGIFCWEVKERHVKHGQFKAWLKDHCPAVSYSALNSYMQLTHSVLESCGLQISSALDICLGGQILLADPNDLPAEARPIRDNICAIVDGKSQRQLMLQFKTVSQSEDGTLHVEQGGGDRQWAKWIWDQHPELIVDGDVPSRKDVPKAVLQEWDSHLAQELAKRMSPAVQRELADKTLGHLEEEIRRLTGSAWILQASRERLMRLREAANILASRCSELTPRK